MCTVLEAIAVKMTVITLFVIVLKLLFKNKLTAKMHCIIWLLPCIQLLFCIGNIQIKTDTSIYNAVPVISTVQAPSGPDYKGIICNVWLACMAIFALWHIITYLLYLHKMHRLPQVTATRTLDLFKEIQSQLGINHSRKIKLRVGTTAQTVSNTILLPDTFSEEEQYHILLHELCHFKHHDNLKLWLALAILCINWFNPLIWIAFRMFRTDIEMLCDERVLKITHNRREYAEVLVKSSAIHLRFVPGAVSASSGKREVFARIKRIVRFSRMKPVWLITAIVGCSAAAALCLTVPKSDILNFNKPTPAAIVSYNVQTQNSPEALPTTAPSPLSVELASVEASEIISDESTPAPIAITPRPKAPSATRAPVVKSTQSNRQTSTATNTSDSVSYTAPVSTDNSTNAESTVTDDTPGISTRGNISGNGSKETYRLDDGTQAVVQYDDGEVKNRYIIVE